MIKLPKRILSFDMEWRPASQDEALRPLGADWLRPVACQHEWKTVEGIFRLYTDCVKCGMKHEDFNGVSSFLRNHEEDL